jgi:hypothetical protein
VKHTGMMNSHEPWPVEIIDIRIGNCGQSARSLALPHLPDADSCRSKSGKNHYLSKAFIFTPTPVGGGKRSDLAQTHAESQRSDSPRRETSEVNSANTSIQG